MLWHRYVADVHIGVTCAGPCADMWALGVRKFDKSLDQRTTGLSEGWHRKLKRFLVTCPVVHQRRFDWCIYTLTKLINGSIATVELLAYHGVPSNGKPQTESLCSAIQTFCAYACWLQFHLRSPQPVICSCNKLDLLHEHCELRLSTAAVSLHLRAAPMSKCRRQLRQSVLSLCRF